MDTCAPEHKDTVLSFPQSRDIPVLHMKNLEAPMTEPPHICTQTSVHIKWMTSTIMLRQAQQKVSYLFSRHEGTELHLVLAHTLALMHCHQLTAF